MPAAESESTAMAAQLPSRLDSVPSFGAAAAEPPAADARAFSSDSGSDEDEDFSFSFAFAPPLAAAGHAALAPASADDLFAGGRIVPAYPVFDRHLLDDAAAAPQPTPDTYCEWAPRSAPGSPSRAAAFPKSASAGEARRHWRLRDLVARGAGRSHSDGKEKFAFLQPTAAAAASPKASTGDKKQAAAPQKQKQGKRKSGSGKAAEMDMATAHRLFYGKQQQGAGALAGDRRPQQQSYLPYRPGIVGFFATAHALGRSPHPY